MDTPTAEKVLKKTFDYLEEVLEEKKQGDENDTSSQPEYEPAGDHDRQGVHETAKEDDY